MSKRPAMQYIALLGQVVGSGPFTVEYDWDHQKFDDRKAAISNGFRRRESDDFNIGVLRDGKLVSLDWMQETVDADPETMAAISEGIGL